MRKKTAKKNKREAKSVSFPVRIPAALKDAAVKQGLNIARTMRDALERATDTGRCGKCGQAKPTPRPHVNCPICGARITKDGLCPVCDVIA